MRGFRSCPTIREELISDCGASGEAEFLENIGKGGVKPCMQTQ
tara:strand:+ start:151 stop:279 length:129 start_codon:yes stop_codon:yes gene_type:complete